MSLTLADVFAPVGSCPNCDGDLLLESDDLEHMENGLVVRCWKCGLTHPCGLEFVEKFIRTKFDDVLTWRSCTVQPGFPNGFIVSGKALFTTSEEIAALTETMDEEGPDGEAGEKLERIRDQEEAIAVYFRSGYVESAYHMASAPHTCAIEDGHSPMICKENVNWIIASPGSLVGDYFNLYGFVLLAWRRLAQQLAEDDTDITNEDEVRITFIDCLTKVNVFGYTYKPWAERSIVISVDGEDVTHFPDVQLQNLAVLELKSFLRNQEYNAAQARALVKADLDKLKHYEGLFSVGFLLCISNKFTAEQITPDALPKYKYPVRPFILSTI